MYVCLHSSFLAYFSMTYPFCADLASHDAKYMSDERFVKYLKYLQYFKDPKYSQYIQYVFLPT